MMSDISIVNSRLLCIRSSYFSAGIQVKMDCLARFKHGKIITRSAVSSDSRIKKKKKKIQQIDNKFQQNIATSHPNANFVQLPFTLRYVFHISFQLTRRSFDLRASGKKPHQLRRVTAARRGAQITLLTRSVKRVSLPSSRSSSCSLYCFRLYAGIPN